MSTVQDMSALVACAKLFGELLLHELTTERLEELRQPEVAAALSELGVEVPGACSRADLDLLAAEFLEAFVRPERGGPLVQSLWEGGSFEGDAAVSVRRLATAAGVEFDRGAARGAAHDHLGCLLLLWSATRESAPEVAGVIEQQHLEWAIEPLARLHTESTFYKQLASATRDLLIAIVRGSGSVSG